MTKKHIILAVETSAAPVSCALILCEGYNLHTAKVLAASSATTPLIASVYLQRLQSLLTRLQLQRKL